MMALVNYPQALAAFVIPLIDGALGLVTAAVVLAAYCWLSRGSWGAAMRAVRDSETAAESIGLNPLVIKTVAFALSALCAAAETPRVNSKLGSLG